MSGTAGRHVLLLGAGLVAPPLVNHLLERTGCRVTIAAAEFLPSLAGLDAGERLARVPLDARDTRAVERLVAGADGVVSLLPASFHAGPARACVAHGKPLVTTSYVSDEIAALDDDARGAGTALLMECGFHPGLNHMLAMRVIDGCRARDESILTYDSFAAGLPAPESNDNSWGYKFSWSPAGVLSAALEPATMLIDGEERHVPGGEVFRHPIDVTLERFGRLEAYPNRSALKYRDLYGLDEVRTMRRCTLRYPGHCAAWDAMIRLGLLGEDPLPANVVSPASLVLHLAGAGGDAGGARKAAADALGLARGSEPIERLAWLGLFSDAPLPSGCTTPRAILLALMTERLAFAEGERDVVVLHDRFEIETSAGARRVHEATLVDEGRAGGESAMARMVGLPAALAIEGLLGGTIRAAGVEIPVRPGLYEPILAGLARIGVQLDESA